MIAKLLQLLGRLVTGSKKPELRPIKTKTDLYGPTKLPQDDEQPVKREHE